MNLSSRSFRKSSIALISLFCVFSSVAEAGPITRFFSEALEGVLESTPYFASKAARKGLSRDDKEDAEAKLAEQLSAIDEKTGKMANVITSLIFNYHLPEQKTISEKEYRRIKAMFKDKVRGNEKEKAKLVFLTHLKCSAYALDVLTSFGEKFKASEGVSQYQQPILELKKCSNLLSLVKGHDARAVAAYEDFSVKFSRIAKEAESLDQASRASIAQAMGLLLFGLKSQYKSVENAANEWF